ncbi:MAG: SGNH/GDSL hydrolase family protein [Bacteroidota bacterium]
MKIRKIKILSIFLLLPLTMLGQNFIDTLSFINHDKNIIIFNDADPNLAQLIDTFQKLKTPEAKKINILHIGDSHLQAGFYTEKMKQNLFQNMFPDDTICEPGFIFPFTMAQTNNPFFYKVDYTGTWDWCKNTDSEKDCLLGLAGITVATNDSLSTLSIKMQNRKYDYPVKYYFNRIKILHSHDSAFSIFANDIAATINDGYSIIQLDELTDSINLRFINRDTTKKIELYGIVLENSNTKMAYHTIGVNGATAQSYQKCELFSSQLAQINPGMIIISLGTNEAFSDEFSQIENEFIVKDLLYQIKDISKESAIILAVPGDHYKNELINTNIGLVRENFMKIQTEMQTGIWDFYTVMGGENSIIQWYEKNLTAKDKLHFNRQGYEMQGEIFVDAFFKLLEIKN